MTRLVAIVMGVSAVWFSTSCDVTNRNVTERHALEHAIKSPALRFVPYEMMVKFMSGVSQERIVSILKGNRTDVIAEILQGRLYYGRILDARSVASAIAELTSYPEVEYAEPNYRYETQK